MSSFCLDVNECDMGSVVTGCHTNADCTNLVGSFDCQCKLGYSDPRTLCQGEEEEHKLAFRLSLRSGALYLSCCAHHELICPCLSF